MTFEPTSGGELEHQARFFLEASEEARHYARALRQHFTVFKDRRVVPPQFIYAAHALTEAGRLLGVRPLPDLAGALEDWLRAHKGDADPDAERVELLEEAVTTLEGMARDVSEGRAPQSHPGLVQRLRSAGGEDRESPTESHVRDDVDVQLLPVFLEEADDLCGKIHAVLRAWRESPTDERHAQSLKRLLHTLKGSARMAGAMRIGEIVHVMEDLAGATAEAREQPSFRETFDRHLDDIAGLLGGLRSMGAAMPLRDVPDVGPSAGTSRTGRGPFAGIGERLYRTVRQTAKELNKRANLELPAGGVEIGRDILERVTAPLEHLLRNAIVHGLESEPERIRNGKAPIGEIRLVLRREGGEVVFEVADDGAGLNYAALREKALQQGLLRGNEEASEERLAQLIFVPGFSTAPEVNEIAGRGVGLDVVMSEVDALGGRIEVSSKNGQGTRFIIRLPG